MDSTPRRALLVVDVQNEYVTGRLPIEYPALSLSLANIGRAMDGATAAGIPVIVVQNSLPTDSPVFAQGGFGWQLHEVVAVRPHAHYLEKTLPSAFVGTGLGEWLAAHDIDTLTVIGYMTHNCDDATVKHAVHLGLAVELVSDATGALPYENSAGCASAEEIHRIFTVVMHSRFAAVVTTDQWLAAVAAGTALPHDTIFGSNRRARGRRSIDGGGSAIDLRPFTAADAALIAAWPAYPAEFGELDYALRPGGWLDDVGTFPGSRCFVAEGEGGALGFALLVGCGDGAAELRIALHPARLGRGIGTAVLRRMLALAFADTTLDRLHLIVRKNNNRARRLYSQHGFLASGECDLAVGGCVVRFLRMELPRAEWRADYGAEPVTYSNAQ